MATIGKNILDNLTTGMYSDSKVIYREYIQNACDQIDEAIKRGILSEEDACVDIFIDENKRYISIRDNATGISRKSFIENIGDIANSNKKIGENKGFRGIGRLCGLAYCKTLRFTTSYANENVRSIMTCNAQIMREMLFDNKKYTLDEIWDKIISFTVEPDKEESHYFEVELIDINSVNQDLLNSEKICDYLSFVAPVPYCNNFLLRNQIYNHSRSIGYHIDEYCIKVNGKEIFKDYYTRLKEPGKNGSPQNYDEIFKCMFKDFRDQDDNIIAWLWIGLSRFERQIPPINRMRGIRIRSSNIQIGDDNALHDLFKESRGNYYFVGELFAVSKDLIPNSQRNYFNENETRVMLEGLLMQFFYADLHKLYTQANRIKNDFKKQKELSDMINDYNNKVQNHGFVNDGERQRDKDNIDKAAKEAEAAKKRLEREKNEDTSSPLAEVRNHIEKAFESQGVPKPDVVSPVGNTGKEKKKAFVTDAMSKLSKNERKLVSKILNIITDVAPKDIADQIIDKIKDEMR